MSLPARAQIVIVGGGPAGLASALSLAREAPGELDEVLVLERASYPRDKICAGGLGARADTTLALLGVAGKQAGRSDIALICQRAENNFVGLSGELQGGSRRRLLARSRMSKRNFEKEANDL